MYNKILNKVLRQESSLKNYDLNNIQMWNSLIVQLECI